jgi:NADH:ubiquinone oxidoreductase subunit 5 (subunit L)/multisubunit Na+/H+ antiporter MnhA subunit
MPVTFFSCLIASLSISGIPPLNGFVSKWMIYQGIIGKLPEAGTNVRVVYLFCIVAAMFASALTVASFMKLLHGVFLGQAKDRGEKKITEVRYTMWIPTAVLASLCVGFGVFAYQIPLKYLIIPAVNLPPDVAAMVYTGMWNAGTATALIIAGFVIGLLIYISAQVKTRRVVAFVGGETLPGETRVTGSEFYLTVKDFGLFKTLYYLTEKGVFDIYNWGRVLVSAVSSLLSRMHTGNLHIYLSWSLIGISVLFLVLSR